MRILNTILILLVALLGVTFAILNAEPVTINYYFGTSTLPLSLLLAFAMVLGAAVGLLSCLSMMFHLKKEMKRLRKGKQS